MYSSTVQKSKNVTLLEYFHFLQLRNVILVYNHSVQYVHTYKYMRLYFYLYFRNFSTFNVRDFYSNTIHMGDYHLNHIFT